MGGEGGKKWIGCQGALARAGLKLPPGSGKPGPINSRIGSIRKMVGEFHGIPGKLVRPRISMIKADAPTRFHEAKNASTRFDDKRLGCHVLP